MLRSCCVTRYLRRSAEADLFGERPSLCAVPDTWENRVSGTSAAFPREHTSLRGSMRVFFWTFFPVLLPRPQTVPLRGSHRPKIFGLRERRIPAHSFFSLNGLGLRHRWHREEFLLAVRG